MALINCPECGKEISDKAQSCPNCGCPASEWNSTKGAESDSQANDNDSSDDILQSILRICGRKNKIKAAKMLCERTGIGFNEAINIIDIYFDEHGSEFEKPEQPHTICPECGKYNPPGKFICQHCNHRYTSDEYHVIFPWEEEKNSILYSDNRKDGSKTLQLNTSGEHTEFNGIYRYGMLGGKKEVYCPRCKSADCSHYQEQKIIPGKSKTRYTVNLNPLKPFTVLNKKQKVVRDEQLVTENKFICNKCGNIFY